MRRALLILTLLLGLPAQACPFCDPGEADVFSDIAGAQAVVLVERLETRKYKVLSALFGPVKPGRVVVAAEPQGVLGKKGHLLLTTAGPPNLPYWSDAPRVLDERELAFAQASLRLRGSAKSAQWDFAARHLQDPSPEISAAAYNLLAAAPLLEVQKRARLAGQERLVSWAKDAKVAPERRALYLLMSYRGLSAQDGVWLKKLLFDPGLSPSSPYLGPLAVAYLHVSGRAGLREIERSFYPPDRPASRITPLNRALTLVSEQTGDTGLASDIRALFIKELDNPRRGAFVLAPLAIWNDRTGAEKVEALFRKNGNVTWVKVAVIRYFRSLPGQASEEALARLAKLDPDLVARTTDPYRRADLGLD